MRTTLAYKLNILNTTREVDQYNIEIVDIYIISINTRQ